MYLKLHNYFQIKIMHVKNFKEFESILEIYKLIKLQKKILIL